MKLLLDYQGNTYIGSISLSDETTDFLMTKNLNPIRIVNNTFTLVREKVIYTANEELTDYLDNINELDVIEISSSGIFTHLFSQDSDDATVFVTERCNSNCIMCPYSESVRRKGWLTDGKEQIILVNHFPDSVKHITITGGEPFMIKDNMFTVLDIIKQRFTDIETLLLTNGRVLCLDNYITKLHNTAPNSLLLGIPLHSHDEIIHDGISRSQDSFRQTVSAISKLINNGFNVEIRVVVSRINYNSLNELADFICQHFRKAYRVVFIGLEMVGNAAINREKVWIPYSVSAPFIESAIDILTQAHITSRIYNYPLCLIREKYWSACDLSISDYKRTYSETCDKCKLRPNCAGLFRGTYTLETNELKAVE